MYEIFFYTGIVFAIGLLIISFVLFFTLRIQEVIQYYIGTVRHRKSNKNTLIRKSSMKTVKSKRKIASLTTSSKVEATEILHTNPTEVEMIARNYATAMLNADESTEILSD